jgi:hypothetical protein
VSRLSRFDPSVDYFDCWDLALKEDNNERWNKIRKINLPASLEVDVICINNAICCLSDMGVGPDGRPDDVLGLGGGGILIYNTKIQMKFRYNALLIF